jgi:hypothetical protein
MKKYIIGFLALMSISAFGGECRGELCGTFSQRGNSIVISNIQVNLGLGIMIDVQARKSMAEEFCVTFGDAFTEYRTTYSTRRSCRYLATKGRLEGSIVRDCSPFGDAGAFGYSKVFSTVRCFPKK